MPASLRAMRDQERWAVRACDPKCAPPRPVWIGLPNADILPHGSIWRSFARPQADSPADRQVNRPAVQEPPTLGVVLCRARRTTLADHASIVNIDGSMLGNGSLGTGSAVGLATQASGGPGGSPTCPRRSQLGAVGGWARSRCPARSTA